MIIQKNFYQKYYFCIFFSLLVAGSTSAIAWLLDPAIKKIFIEKDQTLILFNSTCNNFAFSLKGFLYILQKQLIIKVGQEVTKILQFAINEINNKG